MLEKKHTNQKRQRFKPSVYIKGLSLKKYPQYEGKILNGFSAYTKVNVKKIIWL